MKHITRIHTRYFVSCLWKLMIWPLALLPLTPARAQTILSITHNDTYDFSSSTMTNLITNPDFEQHPAGFTNQAWYAVINTTSGCGYNVVPGWTGGPSGYECYATLALLRPSGPNLIFNDAYPALGGTGTCNGPVYVTTPDFAMVNSPLVAASDAATNWIMYLGDWEDTKKITGTPVLNLTTGEVAPQDTALSFIADNSGSNSANLPKQVGGVSQTINVASCHTYELEFFLTGEGLFGSSSGPDAFYAADGILELTIGSHLIHLMSPGTGNFHGLGSSEIYHIQFVTNSSSISIQFASPGHLQKLVATNSPAWGPYLTAPAGGAGTVPGTRYHSSEVVMDGVRLFDLGTANCTVLGPELIQFDAARRDDGVYLTWSTAIQAQIRSFGIQRSMDGIEWSTIGTMAGPSMNGAASQFSYTDVQSSPNKAYYRIQLTGMSGNSQYSTVKVVQGVMNDAIRIMPNPVTDRLTIAGAPGLVFDEVQLADVTGKTVLRYRDFAAGGTMPLAGLSSGIYFLTLQRQGDKVVKKILKN